MKVKLSKVILLLLSILVSVHLQEIDNFNILLPTAYHPTHGHAKQIIKTSGGCYRWESTQTSVVSVTGVSTTNKKCNQNGIIELKQLGQYSNSVYVSAIDEQTEKITAIPVRIKDLNKIAIFTKIKTMNIKEIQNLEIYGFDLQNNTFTSLEGLTFEWQIINQEGRIIKIPLVQASLFMPLDTRKQIQSAGSQSDYLVIKAQEVGSVKIRVKCLEAQYTHISDEITIYIQQKFEIDPSSQLSILVGSSYQLYLKTLSGKNITLPASQYKIKTDNGFRISDQMYLTAPSYKSKSFVNVSDSRTAPAYASSLEIEALDPDRIQIICPDSIVIGKSIKYRIQFYYKNQILKGIPNLIQIDVPSLFNIDKKQNIISTNQKTVGEIKVNYNGLTASKIITSVTAVAAILPTQNLLVLPIGELYSLKVVGGSGLYRYEIENRELGKIGYSGSLSTRAQGETIIQIVDEKNIHNYVYVKLIVKGFNKLETLEPNKQANINEVSSLFIAAIPQMNKKLYYTECNDAIKTINLKSSPLNAFEILPIYGASSEALSELKNQMNANKYLRKQLESRSIFNIGRDQFLKNYQLYVKSNDISLSQLDQLVDDMENYGLCSKIPFRGLSPYSGRIIVSTGTAQQNINIRVYDELGTDFDYSDKDPFSWINKEKMSKNQQQITMTPLSSFTWILKGGSIDWFSPTQFYLNGVKLDKNSRSDYPIIHCPQNSKPSRTKYIIQLRNPKSSELLRPVSQDEELTIICQLPSKMKTTVLSRMPITTEKSLTDITSNSRQNGKYLIYVRQKQDFYILLEPLTKKGQAYYNSSNTLYSIEDTNGLQDQHKGNGYKILQYKNQMMDDQFLVRIIGADTKIRYTAQDQKNVGQQIKQNFIVKIIDQMKLNIETEADGGISIPNNPSMIKTIPITTGRTYKIKGHDQSLLKIWKDHSNHINIQSKGISGKTTIQIIDDQVLGSPSIQLPVRIYKPDGIELRIQKNDKKPKQSATNISAWFIEGEQMSVALKTYYLDDGILGKKLLIKDLELKDISVDFQSNSISQPKIKQIQRYFNKDTGEVIIRYLLPKIPHSIDSNSKRLKQGMLYRLNAKVNQYQLTSNNVNVRVFAPISIEGIQQISPKILDFYLSILQSCRTHIQIRGGPQKLESLVISNIGQNYQHKITKIANDRYEIDALKAVETNSDNSKITGDEENLIVINLRYDGYDLGSVRFLVDVRKIGEFGISGLSSLIKGKNTRYIATADNVQMMNIDSCDFKFIWKNAGNHLMITSDPYLMGINATALKHGEQFIEVQVKNNNEDILGKASKIIKIVDEFHFSPLIKSEQNLVLLPPNSGIVFPEHFKIEQVSPCDQQNYDVAINSNKIISGAYTSDEAEILKISSTKNPSQVPSYINLLVTKICAITIENNYGSLHVHRNIPVKFKYNLMDCYGRKFNYPLMNINYKIAISDGSIAKGEVDSSNNIISIEGLKIGKTILQLQIINQQNQVKDIVPIYVNIFIEPSRDINVHVGDEISFKAATSNSQSIWESSNTRGLPIDRNTGKARAEYDGQYQVNFGSMEATVTVTRLTDISKTETPFVYQPIYSNGKQLSSHPNIKNKIKWTCEILGVDAKYFNSAHQIRHNPETGQQQIICEIQRSSEPSPRQFSKFLEVQVSATVPSKLQYQKTFVEPLNAQQFFMIVSDKKIQPQQQTGIYHIIIETKQRLEVHQTGGKDSWIIKNEHNGAKQVVFVDFTQKESTLIPWSIHLFNPKTSQRETISIGKNSQKQEKQNSEKQNKGGWKWTDILVLVMGINFVLICLYQVCTNSKGSQKYHEY